MNKSLKNNQRHRREKPNSLILLALSAGLLLAAGCGGGGGGGGTAAEAPQTSNTQSVSATSLESVLVPDSFDFEARDTYRVDIRAVDPNGNAYAGVPVYIQSESEGMILQGITDQAGAFTTERKFAPHITEVTVTVSALGIANTAVLPLDGSGVLSHTFQ